TRRVWLAPEGKRRNKLILGAIGKKEPQARLSGKTRQIGPRVPFRQPAAHENCRGGVARRLFARRRRSTRGGGLVGRGRRAGGAYACRLEDVLSISCVVGLP